VVAPYDETQISSDDVIIRRVSPREHVVPDENRNCRRISSKLYKPSTGTDAGMSVDIEKLITTGGHNPRQYVVNPVFTGAVAFSARAIRSLGLWIGYEPVQGNPYHGEIWSNVLLRHNRFTGTQVNGLGAAATWYVPLEGVELR
jgi:hypothetical protein